MIKFKTPKEKKEKFKTIIDLLKKENPFAPKFTTNGTYGGYTSTTPTWIYSGTGTTTGTITTNSNINSASNQIITSQTSNTITNSLLNSNVSTNQANVTIGGFNPATGIFNGNSILNNGNNITITPGTSNIYTSYALTTYTLFGTEISIPLLYNGEMLISLINTLGIEFWDEYKIQGDFITYNYDSYVIIEEALKQHRRDHKLNDILDENNDK